MGFRVWGLGFGVWVQRFSFEFLHSDLDTCGWQQGNTHLQYSVFIRLRVSVVLALDERVAAEQKKAGNEKKAGK